MVATLLALQAAFLAVTAAWFGLSGDEPAFMALTVGCVVHAVAACSADRAAVRTAALCCHAPAAALGLLALADVGGGAANGLYATYGVLALLSVVVLVVGSRGRRLATA